MSKITNVRLPNAATGEYDARQFDQLVPVFGADCSSVE